MCYADILVFNPHFFGVTENGERVRNCPVFQVMLIKFFFFLSE